MSERLTPEQQLEMRVRMGSEVQGLSESVSGSLPRDPDAIPLSELVKVPIVKPMMSQQALAEFMQQALGIPVEFSTEDRLRAAIVEACQWLQQGAPGCALQTLENALKL